MTMHRLFNDRARSYILVDVKTNSEESSSSKKLFLYEFSLSMLSHMNYICIHSDKWLWLFFLNFLWSSQRLAFVSSSWRMRLFSSFMTSRSTDHTSTMSDSLLRPHSIQMKVSWVHNEIDAQLIISKYKKNTMKRKRKASYRSEKIMCFSLRVLVSN